MTVLLLFPVVIATIYEYVKINENEELISTVYKEQLETIVSSINSYTLDISDTWGTRLELWLRYPSDSARLKKMVAENQSIKDIYLADENKNFSLVYGRRPHPNLFPALDSILNKYSGEIEQLKNYYRNGYRKLISVPGIDKETLLLFIAEDPDQKLNIFFVNIDLLSFFQNQVSPRIQSIAQEHFRIDLLDRTTGNVLISTEQGVPPPDQFDQEGSMWFFPNIKIGIGLKNQTIAGLANRRIREGLRLMALVLLVMFVGIWFLFVSVKREIELARIKSEFISNVSHEIRTPLALISMYIETLEMGRIKTIEKVNEYYQIISKETQRLTGMVNKILNFSRLESGRQKFDFDTCNLNIITQKVLDTYQFHLKNKGFEVNYNPASNLKAIRCDKEAIADALINLIDNAVKYSREKKKIEITTGIRKNDSFVEVKDHGPGIPKKKQRLVFDKFYRVTTGDLAHEVKGTGLGLAIVNEIVKAHKGKVTLTSKPGEGCSFRLYFPMISADKG
ncbi:sensor histidine kinase [Thermophagus sp. OGC60D27]|uniref:sensor histidine kinase n=1 Tax=Thermophagus sp. OGC60D27 TaxID=3458415 RepID=UPI004037630A